MSLIKEKAHFDDIDWCARLLNAPGTIVFPYWTRTAPTETSAIISLQHILFNKTLNNPDAVPHCIGFCEDPGNSHTRNTTPHDTDISPRLVVPSATLIFDLQPGVNGANSTVHGGLIAALADESMGNYLVQNRELYQEFSKHESIPAHIVDLANVVMFTVNMNVSLRKAISTPQVILVETRFRKIEGRKVFLDVFLTGEQGVEYARCEALWLTVAKEKASL
ncbi:hypothetical protein ANO11243_042340 [Dothideomycetidae sp. 11243]|nr:hypothetical protein ANO11243_042340 [fungal sp. No.11243]